MDDCRTTGRASCGQSPTGAESRAGDSTLAHHHDGDAICVENVSFGYNRCMLPAVDTVTMHIPRGTRLGVIGPNGGGKTTLLRLIVGLLAPDQGQISIFGNTPAASCRLCDIGYVPQKHDIETRFPLSVRQVVRMGLTGRAGLLRKPQREDLDAADRAMELVGVAELARRPIGDLSGGQQQRVMIARALAPRPRLLVLDEPMIGIDEIGQQQFARMIESLHEALELTLIMVSHDLRGVAAGCDQVACLNRTLHFHDAPGGLTPTVLNEVFRHSFEDTAT